MTQPAVKIVFKIKLFNFNFTRIRMVNLGMGEMILKMVFLPTGFPPPFCISIPSNPIGLDMVAFDRLQTNMFNVSLSSATVERFAEQAARRSG